MLNFKWKTQWFRKDFNYPESYISQCYHSFNKKIWQRYWLLLQR